MKSRNIILCLHLIFAFSLYSCRKIASNVDPPEFRQKLVINAYLSPDKKENIISISSNQKRFGELHGYYEPFGDVNLFLYENSREIHPDTTRLNLLDTMHFDAGYKFIIKNFQFKEGNTYHIKAISDIGLEAEATCKIPERRDFRITVDTSSRKTTDEYGMKLSILNARISIMDFPGEANYYRLLCLYEIFRPSRHIIKSAEPNDWQYDHVKSDAGLDGQKFVLRSIKFESYPDFDDRDKPDSAFLRIYLLSTDKPYYDFHKSAENFSLGDGPFTEPTLLYSNVSGGLGIFASYTLDSLIYRIK